MTDSTRTIAATRPTGLQLHTVGAYLHAFVFYGPMGMLLLLPFDLPQQHFAYYCGGAYIAGVIVSLFWIQKYVVQARNLTVIELTTHSLALGKNPQTIVRFSEIADTIPITYRWRLLRTPEISVTPMQFNRLLFRMRDGSRLAFVPVANLEGSQNLVQELLRAIEPTFRQNSALDSEDVAAIRQLRCNTLLPP